MPYEETPHESRATGTQTGGGSGLGDQGNHERRIQKLELGQEAATAAMNALKESHEVLRKDLFGDPLRRDAGGAGAFSRIEGMLRDQTTDLTSQITAMKSNLQTEEQSLATARDINSKRRWDLIIGVIAGLAAGAASAVGTLLATGHHL